MTGNPLLTFRTAIDGLTRRVDPVLLVFLLLLMYVSLAAKLLAVIFIYVMRPNFKFGILSGRIPSFYLVMALLAAGSLVLYAGRGINYVALAGLVIVFWIASLLITHQLRLAVERLDRSVLINTIAWFFIINAAVSAINLVVIMLEIASVNPYVYVGKHMKYFDSTGDFIKGVTFDLSTVNMIINSFAIFFFLYQRRFAISCMCFLVAMFTTSNLGNFILFFFILCVIIADRDKFNKSLVLCYLAFMIIFISKISPSNLNYANSMTKKLFKLDKPLYVKKWEDNTEKNRLVTNYINSREKKEIKNRSIEDVKIRTLIKEKRYRQEAAKVQEDTVYKLKELDNRNFFHGYYSSLYGDTLDKEVQHYYRKHPGKVTAVLETFDFVKQGPKQFLIGAGAGNFSSKLAFKASNIQIVGKYIEKYKYVAPEFKENHFKITLQYLMRPVGEHSVVNFPNSVLNQLLGEYGVVGLAAFFILYVGFFLRKWRKLTYGAIILPMCLAYLLTDYFFESLSIILIFELMMYAELVYSKKSVPEHG